MKKIAIIALFAVLGFLAYKFFFSQERIVSVLVFSKTAQFRHGSIEAGQVALMKLGKENGFTVDTTENAGIFKEETLAKYNVVVFLNTTGDILNETQQLEFNRFIQAGGGYIGIHAAADTEYNWPWYGKLVGAYFESHPNSPNVRDATIDLVNANHESSKMLPEHWDCTDEWYNYKDINPNINVLLNLNETSYEGGTNGEKHPIAWYHDYDGGRSWYTGRGHTDESFSEPEFLAHLLGGINYAAGEGKLVDFSNASVAPDENRFTKVVLEDHLEEPMELEILPDGQLLFIQRKGAFRIYDPEEGSSSLIKKLNVFSDLEDGLLGLALDPNFKENNWVYLFYSDPVESHQNVARFTLSEDYRDLVPDSEKILLKIPTQREECCHSAGSIEFGPNGLLYIATGDNTSPRASDGFSPSDEQAGRMPWDAQKSSANTNDLRGKVLRIMPTPEGTYTIPEGNLFPPDGSAGKPEIFVMGCRNPFRISIDQHTGYLYWGDVGPDASKDSIGRGPRGYDEVNQAKEAGFYGWPYFIGNNQAYNKYDFATKTSGVPYDLEKPINQSPNNTGAELLPPAKPAFIWYPYGTSKDFPGVGDGGRNAMAGPVYYMDDFPENENRFPAFYNGKLFTYDWMRGWIMAVTMDEKGDFEKMDRFLPSFKFNNLTDMIFGPNGDIYLLEYGTVWFSENPDARLVHLVYNSGNRKPLAVIDTDKKIGKAPLTVQFNSAQSKDFDGDKLAYEWYFEDGETVSSTEQNPIFRYEESGTYQAKLVLKDSEGEFSETAVEILVGNELPQLTWGFNGNQSFFWEDEELDYIINVSDAEDGTLGNGIDANQVNISIDYLERGFDANEIAMGHAALQESSLFILGERLMNGSDCNTCHQMDVKSVGPTYKAIAKKYLGDTKATAYLATKIINGGAGVWGGTAMAAHPQLSTSEAQQMSKYILSLADGATDFATRLKPKGSYKFNQHQKGTAEGRYILNATYKDRGGDKIGGLTAREMIVLRSPMVAAAAYDEIVKAMKFTVTPELSQGMLEEDMDIVLASNGSQVIYKGIDLTGIQGIKIGHLNAGPAFIGGTISIHLDKVDSPALVETPVESALLNLGFAELALPIPTTKGKHDIYIKFTNEGETDLITAVNYFYFSNVAVEKVQ